MKLLVVSHACVTAVNQSFFADLEAETQWRVSLVMPSRWKTEYGMKDGTERWSSFGGTVHPVDVLRPGDVPRHVYKNTLVSLIRNEQPDAIYVHHEPYGFATAQVYLANKLTGSRPIGFYAAQNISKRYPVPVRWMEQWVFGRSDFAFPVTESALEVLRHKGYRGAAEVLPLAVNAEVYRPYPEWSATQRRSMGLGVEDFVVGYVGRLVKEKGLDVLLSALAALTDVRWQLVLLGNGAQEAALRERAERMGYRDRVHFLGYVPHEEAPRWLSLFDVLALPSQTRPNWKEQFGRVLVEAMACGTPVIGSDSGEIPYVIANTGGGLTFPEGDQAALSAVLTTLAHSPTLRSQLADCGRKSVHDRYDQRKLVLRFAALVQQSVHRSPQTAVTASPATAART